MDELRARILSGELVPGTPMRQEALADQLGVSRIPVREAIRLLSSEGLVDHIPHKGSYVSMLSKSEVREFFDLRLRLEPWLLFEAASSMTAEHADRAQALLDTMDEANGDDWGRLNWQLHELLYLPAERPAALAIVRSLHEKSERYFRFQVFNRPIKQQARTEHQALITFCRHHQAKEAEVALTRHIEDAADQILAIVSRLIDKQDAAGA